MTKRLVPKGLETKFIKSWDSWDEAGESGDLQFYNQQMPLELTDYAKTILFSHQTEQPFTVCTIYMSKSTIEFMREDETTVSLAVELVVKKV
jgi:hypothetical protein